MPSETWYVLENDSPAHPSDVTQDKDGVLTHKSGMAVKMRSPGVPFTRSVDPEEQLAKAKSEAEEKAKVQAAAQTSARRRDMQAERPAADYKTR
jgi:hypothetical protein